MNTSHYIGIAALVATLLYIEHLEGTHAHLGFFAWFGFASCVGLAIASLLLGKWLKRKDSYYND